MKKLVVLLLIVFLSLPVFAGYKPIPKNLSKQYKVEIEQAINSKYPNLKKEIDKTYTDAKEFFLEFQNNKSSIKNIEYYLDKLEFYENVLTNYDIYLFSDLVKITEKYADIKANIPGSDSSYLDEVFLSKYFNNNNVDKSKLVQLAKYAENKRKQVSKYWKEVYNYKKTKINFLNISVGQYVLCFLLPQDACVAL